MRNMESREGIRSGERVIRYERIGVIRKFQKRGRGGNFKVSLSSTESFFIGAWILL